MIINCLIIQPLDRKRRIQGVSISILWIDVPFIVGVGLSYVSLVSRCILISVPHCVSILIPPLGVDETGYSVYLGFPGSRAAYSVAMRESFGEK